MIYIETLAYSVDMDAMGNLFVLHKSDSASVFLQGDDASQLESVLDICQNDVQVNDVLSYYF